MKLKFSPILVLLVGSLLLPLWLGGCATKPAKPATYTFFPPPPDEPRIQYLATYSSSGDLGSGSKFADFITGRPKEQSIVVKPYGVGMNNGSIYVCDTMSSACEVFDLAKKRAHYFAPRGEGRLQVPINITFDQDGTRYVADTGRAQVLIFRNDDYVSALGTKDEMSPCDVALTTNRIYVADIKGHGVRVYDKFNHSLLFTIPLDPKKPESKLFAPTNLALDPNGRLLVSDTGAFAVKVFDLDGNYITTIGQQGVAPGLFARPKGIAVDHQGLIYVVDASTQLVQLFNPEGKLLMFFGQPESSVQGDLHLPAGVAVDYDNVGLFQSKLAPGFKCDYLILVTSQVGLNKVNVYGFVTKKGDNRAK